MEKKRWRERRVRDRKRARLRPADDPTPPTPTPTRDGHTSCDVHDDDDYYDRGAQPPRALRGPPRQPPRGDGVVCRRRTDSCAQTRLPVLSLLVTRVCVSRLPRFHPRENRFATRRQARGVFRPNNARARATDGEASSLTRRSGAPNKWSTPERAEGYVVGAGSQAGGSSRREIRGQISPPPPIHRFRPHLPGTARVLCCCLVGQMA